MSAPSEAPLAPTRIVLLGAGGHGKAVLDLLRALGPERFAVVAEAFDAFEADAGLWFVASDAGLSPLYHDLKRRLRPAGPFAVAPLEGVPKFKRMQPGALKWIRERSRRA